MRRVAALCPVFALALTCQFAACASDVAPVSTDPPAPPAFVTEIARAWRYSASFSVPLYLAGAPDSLRCTVTGVAITLSSPVQVVTPDSGAFSGGEILHFSTKSWSFSAQHTGGSISCAGDRGEAFAGTPDIGGVSTDVVGLALNLDFTVTTPVGLIRMCHLTGISPGVGTISGPVTPKVGVNVSRGTCRNPDLTGVYGGSGTFSLVP